MLNLCRLAVVIFWGVNCYSWEPSGNLCDEQVVLVSMAVASLPRVEQVKVLTLGIVDDAIKKLSDFYPQLDVIALDCATYSFRLWEHESRVWQSNTSIAWENQYDAIVIYLALEKDPHREQKLKILYKALKPGRFGIIICTPKDVISVDTYVEEFIQDSEWQSFVSQTPNLLLDEYRTFITSAGFIIASEGSWLSVLSSLDPFDWIGNRWCVPLPMRLRFENNIHSLLRKKYGSDLWWFPNLCRFVVEK